MIGYVAWENQLPRGPFSLPNDTLSAQVQDGALAERAIGASGIAGDAYLSLSCAECQVKDPHSALADLKGLFVSNPEERVAYKINKELSHSEALGIQNPCNLEQRASHAS